MKKYCKIPSTLLLIIFVFNSCQKKENTSSSHDEKEQVSLDTLEEHLKSDEEETDSKENTTNFQPKKRERIKIDTTIWLKDEKLIFKEISKTEFEQQYQSNIPSEILYQEKLNDFIRKDTSTSKYKAYWDFEEWLIQHNHTKDSNRVRYVPYDRDKYRTLGTNIFKLDNGKELKLIDPKGGDGARHYTYRETIQLKNMNFYVYRQDNYEGGNYGLINTSTGIRTSIHGLPQVSPDSTKILITPFPMGIYQNYNGFMLLDCAHENAEIQWEFLFNEGYLGNWYHIYPWRACWLDNQTILCELRGSPFNNKIYFYYCIITVHPYA